MDELRRLEARQLARAKMRSKRRRTSIIRRRTARASLGLFAVLWAIIFGRLATGNDPALSNVRRPAEAPKSGPASSSPSAGESSTAEVESPEPEVEVTEPEAEFAEPETEVVQPEVEYVEPEPEPVITGSS
jgi:hypothetical protein